MGITWKEIAEAINKARQATKGTEFIVIIHPKRYREYMIYKNRWYRRLWRWIIGK